LNAFQIVTFPDDFLRKPTADVKEIDGKLQNLIDQMANTMYQAPGVGLAAIQVRVNQSVLVYDVTPKEDGRQLNTLINPRIVEQEGEILSENEGCLSVPDFRADVKRAHRVLVEAFDRDGKPLRLEAEGFLAIVLQHEIDHLNGKLFIDRISALKRQMYVRRVKKLLRQEKEH
jgi:peptide deformylase